MNFLYAFLIGGAFCLIAQFLMDFFKLLPIHLTLLYVIVGSVLEAFNLYDQLLEFAGAGALVPITNFGHSLTHAAVEAALNDGYVGILTGMFKLSSSGLSFAVISAFIIALIFKPKG